MEISGLHARVQAHRAAILARMAHVVDHGKFILGPEVEELEAALSQWVGGPVETGSYGATIPDSPTRDAIAPSPLSPAAPIHTITCASGTDALRLALMALDIGPGHAVVIPAFGFAAAAEAVILAGATPIFADIDALTFNLNPEDVTRRLHAFLQSPEGSSGKISPLAILAIDTFGLPADYQALRKIADAHEMFLIEDAAQSMGATYFGKRAGSLADIATTSFYPTKTLGCFGDGGAIFTANAKWATRLRRLRDHGQAGKYWHVEVGMNSRLDSIQAAVLLEILPGLDEELKLRRVVAEGYRQALVDLVEDVQIPEEPFGHCSAWSFFTILSEYRDELQNCLAKKGLPVICHYPRILPESPAFASWVDASRVETSGLEPALEKAYPVAYKVSRQCLSLPLHGKLKANEREAIVAAISEFCTAKQAHAIAV